MAASVVALWSCAGLEIRNWSGFKQTCFLFYDQNIWGGKQFVLFLNTWRVTFAKFYILVILSILKIFIKLYPLVTISLHIGDSCKFHTLNPQVEIQSDAIIHLPLKNKGNNTKPPPKVPKPSDTQLCSNIWFMFKRGEFVCSMQFVESVGFPYAISYPCLCVDW